jgi:DNA-binding SARP family transcriptional activator
MSTTRRLASGMLSLVGLLALLVGVPLALAAIVGWPLPHAWPSWAQLRTLFETAGIPDVVLVDALAVVCWIAWLDFAVATIVEIVSLLAGYPAPRLRVVRPWQPLAARMITSIVLATSMMGGRAQPSASPHQSALAAVLAERRAMATAAGPVEPTAPAAVRTARNATPTAPMMPYRVKHGDTLWGISGSHLGNPGRWPAIWRRNHGRAEPDHRLFTDPNLIIPGWTLDVPSTESNGQRTSPTPSAPARPPARSEPPSSPPSSDSPAASGSAALPATGAPRSESIPPPRSATATPPASTGTSAIPSPSHAPTTGIGLPSGGMVGLGLASALTLALSAARLHERRRRRMGSAQVSRVDRLVTPPVGRVTRAATAAVAVPQAQDAEAAESLAPHELLNLLRARACGPAEMPIGVSVDGRDQVIVDTVALSGMTLAGRGAERAARALLVTALADHRPWRAEVLVTDGIASLVDACPPLVNLRVVTDVGAALAVVEQELLRRQRALALRGAADHRSTLASPDPMDTMLVFLDGAALPVAEAGRVDTAVALGRRLGVSVVVVGGAVAFEALDVDENGAISPAANQPLGGACQLFVLSAEEAAEMLAVVAAGQGEPIGDDAPAGPKRHDDGAGGNQDAVPESNAELFAADPVAVGIVATDAGAAADRPVQLRLFGPARVEVLGAEVMTGLRGRGRELLCLLAVRRDGVRQEELIDILWPDEDTDYERSREQLTTAVTSTRRRLRELTNDRGADHILFSGDDRYRLDSTTVDADVWRFEAALQAASRAASDPERLAALEGVAMAQPAEPLAGALYPWAEAVRERLRRRAVDALCELAELRAVSGQGPRAVTALEAATNVDPCCEEVYQRLIALQLRLGRDDAALRAFRELARELKELGEAPAPETAALLQPSRRATDGNGGGASGAAPHTDDRQQPDRVQRVADDEADDEPGARSAVAARRVAVRPRTQPSTSARTPHRGAAGASPPRLPILDDDR